LNSSLFLNVPTHSEDGEPHVKNISLRIGGGLSAWK